MPWPRYNNQRETTLFSPNNLSFIKKLKKSSKICKIGKIGYTYIVINEAVNSLLWNDETKRDVLYHKTHYQKKSSFAFELEL